VTLDLSLYDFELPPEAIAQHAIEPRDAARLLVLRRGGAAQPRDSHVSQLTELLAPGDLLVVNTTRVVPAKLRGAKATGGAAEALVLQAEDASAGRYRALVRCRGRLRTGLKLVFSHDGHAPLDAEVVELCDGGQVVLALDPARSPYAIGETPLPPYIERHAPDTTDTERYQTVYADAPGAVAAPTAGLHLTRSLLERLEAAGVERANVILHVGPGTFRPLGERELRSGRLHAERFELPSATVDAVARTRRRGGRVVAVGTTTTRVLEACADDDGLVAAASGETHLFLQPGARFRAVDALLTNFHLPRSSLLLLVAAFAGRKRVLAAYDEALRRGYRFYSLGDAMLVL